MNALKRWMLEMMGKQMDIEQTETCYIGALIISDAWGVGIVSELYAYEDETWVRALYAGKTDMYFNQPATDCELIAMFPLPEVV